MKNEKIGWNLGIDIGTAYTKICSCNIEEENGKRPNIQELKFERSATNRKIPSVVVQSGKTGKYWFGNKAVQYQMDDQQTGGYVSFHGFKIMLAETSEETLAEYNYKGDNTPQVIYEKFLAFILENVLDNYSIHYSDLRRVVACSPIIWNTARQISGDSTNPGVLAIDSIDIKPKLYDALDHTIRGKTGNPDTIIAIIYEPCAACAYFVDKLNRSFEGHMLVVDYGGGTLDIAVCEVTTAHSTNKSSRVNGIPQVKVVYTEGDGFNTTGRIGAAGISYMQSILENAILQAFGKSYKIDRTRSDYWSALKHLENSLIDLSKKIRENFQAQFSVKECVQIERPLDDFELVYQEKPLSITYGDLAKGYIDAIEPIFMEKLANVREMLVRNGVKLNDPDKFKIGLVGGFCNFDLTKKSIVDAFSKDGVFYEGNTFINIDGGGAIDEEDRSFAVARGASLVAANWVDPVESINYSVGIAIFDNSKRAPLFALKIGETIEIEKKYYVKIPGSHETRIALSGNRIVDFAFEFVKDKITYQNPFEGDKSFYTFPDDSVFYIAFSIDRTGRLKVIIEFIDGITKKVKDSREKVYMGVMQIVSPNGDPIKAE